jgi:hypothetical protein
MGRAARAWIGFCAVTGTWACGSSAPPGVDPNTAFSAAHEIGVKARLAEEHLATCQADTTQCYVVEADLRDIGTASGNLEQAAVRAGAKQ